MARVKKSESSENRRHIRPAISPEARQNQLIGLAIDLVEQRLIDGTAFDLYTLHYYFRQKGGNLKCGLILIQMNCIIMA